MTSLELIRQDESGVYCEQDIAWMLIKFAKYHVEKALKEASENVRARTRKDVDYLDMNDDWREVDKDSILNAYPLENIK